LYAGKNASLLLIVLDNFNFYVAVSVGFGTKTMYLVAHETSKTPGPTNLFREEDNQTDNSITQVMQEDTDQVIPLLPTWHNLSANIIRIVNRRHMPNI
jgi:hypothetical protein